MNAILPAALLATGLISPATAATVAKTYSYFSISGSTLDAIRKQLDKRGPKITGHRYAGATQMTFVNRVGYQTSRNGCRVASASVTVKARIILPHWRRPRAATPEVRLVWDTLLADIKRHEERHVIIAKNHARLLEERLLDIPRQSDCEAALDKAITVTERMLAENNRAQAEFDRIEAVNFDSRMMHLLHNRVERIANGRTPG